MNKRDSYSNTAGRHKGIRNTITKVIVIFMVLFFALAQPLSEGLKAFADEPADAGGVEQNTPFSTLIQLLDSGSSVAEDFPVYIKIQVRDSQSDDYSFNYEKVVKVEQTDVNLPLEVTLEDFNPEDFSGYIDFLLYAYSDEDCTISSESWGDRWGGYYGYTSCIDGYWQQSYYNYETEETETYPLIVMYNYVNLDIPVYIHASDESAYPVYLMVNAFGQTKVIRFEGNEETKITLERINRNTYSGTVTWNLYEDETCSQVHASWNGQANSKRVAINNPEPGVYVLYTNESYPYLPFGISLSTVISDSLQVEMDIDTGELSDDEVYPVYIKAVLNRAGNHQELDSVTRLLSSPEDAEETLLFHSPQDTLFTANDMYELVVGFYADEELTIPAEKWNNATYTGSLGSGQKLYRDASEVKVSYRQLNVDVQPVFFKVRPSEESPVYAHTWVDLLDEGIVTPVIDDSVVNIVFEKLVASGTTITATSILTESAEEPVTPQSASVPTSMNTTFYTDKQQGVTRSSGKLQNDQGAVIVLKPYESRDLKTELQIPVKINLPASEQPYFWRQENSNYKPSVVLDLYQIDPNSGNGNIIYVSENATGNRDTSGTYETCYCWSPISGFSSDETALNGMVSVYVEKLVPGTYYLGYRISPVYRTSMSVSRTSLDRNWTNGIIKVYVAEDGTVTYDDEDGENVLVEFDYVKHVVPKLYVNATYPEQYDETLPYNQLDEYTPRYLSMNFLKNNASEGWTYYDYIPIRLNYTKDGKVVKNIPDGISMLSSSNDRYNYVVDLKNSLENDTQPTWTDTPVVYGMDYKTLRNSDNSISFAGTTAYHYPDGSVVGFPVGEYYANYWIAGSYTNRWYRESLHLYLAEDGNFYKIKEDGTYETEPVVLQIRYEGVTSDIDSLKVKVNTSFAYNIDEESAFTEGDKFVAVMSEVSSENSYTYSFNKYFAIGTAEITEQGISELELKKPDGSPLVMDKQKTYFISYGTYHEYDETFEASGANPIWAYTDRIKDMDNDTWRSLMWDEFSWLRSGRFTITVEDIMPNGEIHDRLGSEDDVLTLENKCLLMPWKETDPDSIAPSDAQDAVKYKPISSISAIKEKGNYIIVAHNQFDDGWYALCTDENGGYSVKLEGVSSLADLQNGFSVGTSEEYRRMVLTASKLNAGSDSISLQLKTNVKDTNGKTIALKMGASSKEPEPLMSTSAGTVIIMPGQGEKQFALSKGNYAYLQYVDELYGYSGFRTNSNLYGLMYDDGLLHGLFMYQLGYNNPTPYTSRGAINAGITDQCRGSNLYVADIDPSYLDESYIQKLQEINPRMGEGTSSFYILSDDVEEDDVESLNKYMLVRTYGDFVNTFIPIDQYHTADVIGTMMFIYTDDDGHEYALDPAGLDEVRTHAVSAGYRDVMTVADHELIPNNNSGTSSYFKFTNVEVQSSGEHVLAISYSLRKSRLNATPDKNYMTLPGGDTAWSKNSDASTNVIYLLKPNEPVYSQADWDNVESYKLSVIRDGETYWLGVKKDDAGKLSMVTVDSEAEAISFTIYAPSVKRYYSSALGTDLNKYFKVYDVAEINAGDEILLIYNDNGTRRIIGAPFPGDGFSGAEPVYVLDSYSQLDIRTDRIDSDTKYYYRLGTADYIKKPYAYVDPDDSDIILAQGVAADAIGMAKSETITQRKYESMRALGAQGNLYAYIKSGYPVFGNSQMAEVNFFQGEDRGQFYVRGGKSDVWIGTGTYSRRVLDIDTGQYVIIGDNMSFYTVGTADRIQVEVYRRASTDETFTVAYHTVDQVETGRQTKPADSFTLTQEADTEHDDISYVFVGWTTDPSYSGYLSLSDSANLYDYDDLSKRASLKDEAKEKLKVLGACNPEIGNVIEYSEVEDAVENGVLKVYPVYAVRGYSTAVTADDIEDGQNRMIVGASDFKDLQNGGDGTTEAKERWLGSINIEVYKDGGSWVPGGSTTGRKRRAVEPIKATLYFAYHNDDAADLNIKFIKDGITAETLYEYMSNGEFDQAEPSHEYLIDAVYAEQGGSEDGLKYKYNWLDEVVGGQLDNVKGGSTVRIFVTTKYQVKYYFDDDGDDVYEELIAGTVDGEEYTWKDSGFYTTAGTENAIVAEEEGADYVVTDDNEYQRLLVRDDTDDGTRFKDEKIARGEYSVFLYKFNDYEHTFHVADLPEPPEGMVLDSEIWTIKKQNESEELEDVSNATPDSDYTVTETTYGTGNSIYSYQNEDLDDVTNTYHLYIKVKSPSFVDIEITKQWDDQNDLDGYRPTAEEFADMVHLMIGEDEVTGYDPDVKDNEDGTYTVTYSHLPENDDADDPITYTVKEDSVDHYTTEEDTASNEGMIVNTHTPDTIDISGEKTWDDAEDQDGIRPTNVIVQLQKKAGGKWVDVEGKTDTITAEKLTFTFTNLQKNELVDGKRVEIEYRVVETGLREEYEQSGGTKDVNYALTNKHEPDLVDVTVNKKWKDEDYSGLGDKGYSRPESITINLLADYQPALDTEGKAITATITPDDEGNWTYTFKDLPKYKSGKPIDYSVTEDAVTGFNDSEEVSEDGIWEVTNTPKEKTSVIDPTQITLLKTDKNTGHPLSGAKFTLKSGEKYLQADGSLGDDEYAFVSGTDGQVKISFSVDGSYTMTETAPEGYQQANGVWTIEIVKSEVDKVQFDKDAGTAGIWKWFYHLAVGSGTDYNKETNTLTVTNTPEITEVPVTKTWDDGSDQDGVRPENVTFQLYRSVNGSEAAKVAGKTITLSVEDVVTTTDTNIWKKAFTDLPAYEDGYPIVYTVKELNADGKTELAEGDSFNDDYTVSYGKDGLSATNSHTTDVTEITVTKIWDDQNDFDGLRPDAETFKKGLHLLKVTEEGKAEGTAGGTAEVTTEVEDATPQITVNEDGSFTIKYEKLQKNEAGKPITYVVKEDAVAGYEAVDGKDRAKDGEKITNRHIPQTGSLKITKALDAHEHVAFGDRIDPATFIFRVDVTYRGKKVYSDVITMVFDKAETQTFEIANLPVGAEAVVEEIYSGGNYKISDKEKAKQTVTIIADNAETKDVVEMAQTAFTNVYDTTWNGGGSVNNHFVSGKEGWVNTAGTKTYADGSQNSLSEKDIK